MQVELRSGYRYVVMLDTPGGDVLCQIVDDNMWGDLDLYGDSMENKVYNDLDIVKVFSNGFPNQFISHKMTDNYLIWERKEDVLIEVDGVEYSKSTVASIIKKHVK